MAIRVLDKVFVRENDAPLALRLHEPGNPLIDFAIFFATIIYLYAFYAGVQRYWATKANKVKGT